ncbi:pyridoxamine 5'-phosphate oxidase family protein [Corynebacterium halotolerans]|uniref:Pyridoxamine 5'-phosphate oxidase family protein n=1 Tax=Corynebacterium halotolerans YIM 70093 = DSM 44683 TaxID=1121362 RepID=M1N040_9CORY|nr:pyridoxamine 5'-phosphate oxidase family protein [Corynebacterium halotolerans]AGF73334.1 hypothetical protein A605_11680 [Corynebacterium halotolerans YIM 70093 = DSM 44683]
MANYSDVYRELTLDQSLARLAGTQPGRVVVHRTGEIDIFPVNFVVDAGNVYFRTAEGSKLFTIHLNNDVLFEADGRDGDTVWSVIVRGTATVLNNTDEIAHAETLGLKPWLPTLKYNWVRIAPGEITGRAFEVTEEPERY